MSTTQSDGIKAALRGCRPAEIEPIVVDAADLESTAPETTSETSKPSSPPAATSPQPSLSRPGSTAATRFATQREADRLRELVRAASFLGAGRIEVRLDEVPDRNAAEPALSALAERARREGVELVRVDDGSSAA